MMGQCSAITGSGERCRGVPVRGSTLCAAHHPDTQAARRAGSRRGGRGRAAGSPGREVQEIRSELAALYADALAGGVDTKVAAVAAQIQNIRLRAVEQERRIQETEELEDRISSLEARFGLRRSGT